MKAHLMFPDRDFDLEGALPPNHEVLAQDLELNTLAKAMAGRDEFFFRVAKQAFITGLQNDVETVRYRQAVLQDCLKQQAVVRRIYDLAVEAQTRKQKLWFGAISKSPAGVLSGSVELMKILVDILEKLRGLGRESARLFESAGFRDFFQRIEAELPDDYFEQIKTYLRELDFPEGVLLSAALGEKSQGRDYMLRQTLQPKRGWLQKLFKDGSAGLSFTIGEKDEVATLALSQLRDRGLNLVANALAQASDHVMSFLWMLRAELAFYLGCVNLHAQYASRKVSVCFPTPAPRKSRQHRGVALLDATLVLTIDQTVVGSDFDGTGKNLVIITGANRGGKSTFLRAIGLAQVMMQSGMFVTAESFTAELCRNVFTHYKREEDATMESGKFDEELKRVSQIMDALTPDCLLLFNESFAATNEREGSEIARQIVSALIERQLKVFFVTHFYEFATSFNGAGSERVLYLRAGRESDGQRTFKLQPGEPLDTSFGSDLYDQIFLGKAKGGVPASSSTP